MPRPRAASFWGRPSFPGRTAPTFYPIYTPGIGFQGGEIRSCVEAGSTYFIVGRSIFQAEDPVEAAKNFRDLSWF
ncbi:MAG: hypothetical protein QXX09_01460 [Candidatus Methanomethylicia archaeon]